MKNLLHFLSIRSTQTQPDWGKLLEFIQEIPPIYRSFCNCYVPDSYANEDISPFRYYNSKYSIISNFGEYSTVFNGQSIELSNLFDLDLVANQIEVLNNSDDEIDNQLLNGLIPIGITHQNAYLLLGTAHYNRDKVYLQNIGEENVGLANDILDFCKNIYAFPKVSPRMPDHNVLYRNWNEDFWRIRE